MVIASTTISVLMVVQVIILGKHLQESGTEKISATVSLMNRKWWP